MHIIDQIARNNPWKTWEKLMITGKERKWHLARKVENLCGKTVQKSWKRCKSITKYVKRPKNLRSTAVFAKLLCSDPVARLLVYKLISGSVAQLARARP